MFDLHTNTKNKVSSILLFVFIAISAFSVFVKDSSAQTSPSMEFVSPQNNTTVYAGDTITVSFEINRSRPDYANVQLYRGSTSVLQIGTFETNRSISEYQTTWTVPRLSEGVYTLYLGSGFSPLNTNFIDSVDITVRQRNRELIQVNPDDVVFDSSTGTYRYRDANQEAYFNQQVNDLYGTGPDNEQYSEAEEVVAVVGDALINSAGQCIGTAVASSVASSLATLTSGVISSATVAPTAIPVNDTVNTAKETGGPGLPSIDSMAYCIANNMIEAIGNSVTDWINNDFELPDGTIGSSYLENPEDFFINLADRTAGEFIGGLSLFGGINLCSPFSLQVRLDLLTNYRKDYRQRAACTLSKVVANIDGFVQGDFLSGGWDAWFEMTQNPANNYYGSYIMLNSELGLQLQAKRNAVTLDLSNGNGFLSYRKCEAYGVRQIKKTDASGNVVTENARGACIKYGPVQTPGSLVEAQANSVLQTPGERLNIADSFDQVVNALINTMMKRILEGFRGTN